MLGKKLFVDVVQVWQEQFSRDDEKSDMNDDDEWLEEVLEDTHRGEVRN